METQLVKALLQQHHGYSSREQSDVGLCPPQCAHLGGHSERQRRAGDGGAVGHGRQHQAGLSQQLGQTSLGQAREGLEDRGGRRRLCSFRDGRVAGGHGVQLRSDDGEGLRHGGDGAVEHLLPGLFHLSERERGFLFM